MKHWGQVGQAVYDPIDERHRMVLPPDVWGDGEPKGVRQRAALEYALTNVGSVITVDEVIVALAP